jgi:hypothetical protein
MGAEGVRFEFVTEEGGRFCESSRCLGVKPEVLGVLLVRPFIAGALPGPGWLFVVGALLGRLFVVGALCDGMF